MPPPGVGTGQTPTLIPVPAPADPSRAPRYITDRDLRPNDAAIAAPKPVPNHAEFKDTLARELAHPCLPVASVAVVSDDGANAHIWTNE